MQYKISDTSVIQITETSGTIQNVSNAVVEISNSAEFTDSFLLYPLNKMTFKEQMYIRSYKATDHTIKINVVPFFVEGGIADTEGSGTATQPDKFVQITTNSSSATAPHNTEDNVWLYTTSTGTQTITNSGSHCTIYTGWQGSKLIYDTGDYNTYVYECDNASINANNVTICGVTENDTIVIHGSNRDFTAQANTGTFVADRLFLKGKRLPAYSDTATFALTQFDSIPAGKHITYQRCFGTAEDVFIYGYLTNTATNTQDYFKIVAGNITNNGDHCTLQPANNTYARNTGDHCLINGTAGNVYVYDDGEYNIYYRNTTNNADTIYGYTENDTIHINNYSALSFQPEWLGYACTINGNASYTMRIKGKRRTGNTNYNAEAYKHLTPGTKLKITKDGKTCEEFIVPYFAAAENQNEITYNYENDCWFFGTDGNDTLDNGGSNVTICAGNGDNSINNSSDNTRISVGAGNNTINSGFGDKVSIYATGFNTINVDGTNCTVRTANNASSVNVSGGYNHSIITGSGNDTLIFGGSYGMASLSDGVNVCTITGNNNSVYSGSGNDSVVIGEKDSWAGDYSWVNLGAGANYVTVQGGGQHTIYSGNGNDYVTLAGMGYGWLNLGAGNNVVDIYDYDNTINCTSGADSIKVLGGYNNSIVTGAGNDFITIQAGYHTIQSGAGNDVVWLPNNQGGQYFIFGTSKGNNTICGFNFSSDYLYIRDNSAVSSVSNTANGFALRIGNTYVTIKGAGNGYVIGGYASVDSGTGINIQYANGNSDYIAVP